MAYNCEIIKQRREALGITEGDAEDCLDINSHAYWDLESFDDDLPNTLSLAQIGRLCKLLRLEPCELLREEPPTRCVSPADLRERILADCRQRQWPLETFGDHVGWDILELIDNPDAYISELNLLGLRDIRSHLGINIMGAIPRPPAA